MNHRVLLVDDSSEVREVYQLALESDGYDVKSVGLAEDALALVADWRPDLIVTDVFMPGMGGFDLITRIRSDLAPPVPAIVALSGFPDAKEEALRRGARQFELKPLSLQGLRDLVSRSLSGSKSRRSPAGDGAAMRRAAARAIGESTLEAVLSREPDVLPNMRRGARALSQFFGHSRVVVFLLRQGRLRICASSDRDTYPLGREASDVLVLANDVVESGATLVLPNARAQALLHHASRKVRFLACVPYVAAGVPVGAMCLVDDTAHEFSSSELAFLEYTAARWSALLSNPLARPMLDPAGVLGRPAFEKLLGYTTEWGIHHRSSMGLTLVETAAPIRDGAVADVMVSLPGPRMIVGLHDRRHIAVFSLGDSLHAVRERLAAARALLGRYVDVQASADLAFEDPIPRLAPEVLMTWAGDVLVHAASTGSKRFLAISAHTTRRGRLPARRAAKRSPREHGP